MKAIVQDAYGSPDDLRIADVPVPEPKPDEVLVRVRAASINFADVALVTGEPMIARLALGLRRPRVTIRGRDVAGVVEAVGTKVSRFQPGDEVYAETTRGTFADFTVVPERLLAAKPANVSFEQAAAVPLAAGTAYQALVDLGDVQPGQHVLINGASGGVGGFAVQIARALGAEVTGVCSTRNVDLVRSFGADHLVDYTATDFTTTDQRYDLILDLAGQHPLKAYLAVLAPKSMLVLSGGTGGRIIGPLGRMVRALALGPFVSQRLRVHAAKPKAETLDALTTLIDDGAVTPHIEATYPLDDTAEALRRFIEQHARSKIVISI